MTTNIAGLLVVAAREQRVREKRVDCAADFAVDGGSDSHERRVRGTSSTQPMYSTYG